MKINDVRGKVTEGKYEDAGLMSKARHDEYYRNLWGPSWTSQKQAQADRNRASLAASDNYHVYTQKDVKADTNASLAALKTVNDKYKKEKAAGTTGRALKAIIASIRELEALPRYFENQFWGYTGYGAHFDGKEPWDSLDDKRKAGIVRTQAQIKKKKEAVNALLAKIGVAPITFTNMDDVAESVTEGNDDGFTRVSSSDFERFAKKAGAEWVYQMGALMLNGEEVGYRREVDRERDRIWYDYYIRQDLMQESDLPPHLAKYVDDKGDFTPDVRARLGRDGERRLLTQPIGSISKDVTPKGYGPEETDESVMTEAGSVHATYLFSMTKVDYDNPANNDTKYFKMEFTVPPGGVAHPQALSRQISENPVFQDLRGQGYINFKTVAVWKDDLDAELADAHDKLNSGKKWLPYYQQELEKTVRTLSQAKKIMSSNEILEGVREAKDPQGVIRKFLDKKLAQAHRAADLAKNPEKVSEPSQLPEVNTQLDEYKPGITVVTRTITLEPDEIATLKKVRWPYGIDMSVRNDQVTFRTAKLKTLAKILNKYIDFGATDVGTVLDLPAEMVPFYEADDFDPVAYVGARVAKAGKRSSLRDPNKRTRDEEDALARKLAAKDKAKPVTEVGGYAANGAVLLIANNGKVTQKVQLPLDPKMHHIAQELRKLGLGLNDFEMTSAARDLAGGQTYRKGPLAMQVKATTPTEMR